MTSQVPRWPGDRDLDAAHSAALWTIAAEPGDAVAEAVRDVLGPREAMHQVLAGTPAADLLADAEDALSVTRLAKGLDRWRARLAVCDPGTVVARAADRGIRIVHPGHPDWPEGLERLGTTVPAGLWIRGNMQGLAAACASSVAIVGARDATEYGLHVAGDLAFSLGEQGVTVLSGAAFGIDAAAHRGALAVPARPGTPATVAVMACGVDVVYPTSHASLLAAIAERGCIVSEYPPGTRVARHRFLQRNRVLAGLSGAVLIAEARVRSGALSTANWAATYGIPLGAVPGPVTSAASAGCHKAMREYGAVVIAHVDHAAELLQLSDADPWAITATDRDALGEVERIVLNVLPASGGDTTEDVAVAAGLPLVDTLSVLATLEAERWVESTTDDLRGLVWRAAPRATGLPGPEVPRADVA